MAWLPIARTPIQYEKTDGNPANGYYLKFYLAGTTTPTAMATDTTGATQLAKCKLNERGFPISNASDETSIFIPHVNSAFSAFKYVIYQSAADADANNFAAAIVNLTSVSQIVDVESYLTAAVLIVNSFSDLSSTSANIGQQVSLIYHTVSGYGGGLFDVISSSGQTNDGGVTVINGGIAFKRRYDNLSAEYFGCNPTSDSKTNWELFLTYLKSNQEHAIFTCDIKIVADSTVDIADNIIDIDFNGYKIVKDGTIELQNVGNSSVIANPSMYNATTPYVITRWDASGNWLSSAAALASLTQTNAVGYYQPSVNDTDIYASLPANVQSQNIFSRLKITSSDYVTVKKPKGRHCLYEFLNCNDITIESPSIMSGGKGTYGTILFNNATSTAYGLRNKIVGGGYIGYGSYSGATWMRNKFGGATGGLIPFRSGESGVKTYQNEVGGYSARCYEMEFGDISPFQTVFDGIDVNSDFGTPAERVNDYLLAQYGWNQLPTRHTIYNIKSIGANGLGIWGDGQFNTYSNIKATGGNITGIHLRCYNSEIIEAKSQNNNKNNVASGTHQILLEGIGNRVVEPFVECDASITQGYTIYSVAGNDIIGEKLISSNSLPSLIPSRGTLYSNGVELGATDAAQSALDVVFYPRKGILNNPIGRVRGTLEVGTPGSEQGNVSLNGVASGAYVAGGLVAHSQGGGFGGIGVASVSNAAWLINSEVMLYQSGANLVLLWKKADGTTATVNLI